MELIDLNMVDKVLSDKEFTIQEYIANTVNSQNDIEVQVDHIEKEIKNYRYSRILFIILGILSAVFLLLNTCFIANVSLHLIILNVLVILLCLIIINLNTIIINKLYMIEMGNQIVGIYYKKYENQAGRDIRSILAKY